MTSESVPLFAKQQLGAELAQAREAAHLTQEQAVDGLDFSVRKLQNMEAGRVKVSLGDLNLLMDRYGLDDSEQRERLMSLRAQGRERGWWVKYGKLPQPYVDFIALESAAVNIQAYSPLLVSGLLQTEDYARSVAQTASGPVSDEDVARQTALRIERQQRTLRPGGPTLWVILEEACIRRLVGGPEVMTQQLEHLLKMAENPQIAVQVMPLVKGGHPGVYGEFTLMEFPPGSRAPVVYAAGMAGTQFLTDHGQLQRCKLAWQIISANAADQSTSLRMIRHAISEIGKIKESQ